MFKDLNFKISVMGALHELGYYNEDVEHLKRENYDWYNDYQPIPMIVEYYKNLKINPSYLAEIEYLQPDGGDLCYQYLFNVWDGEDDQFDIQSIEGIELLVNLKSFEPISMISEHGLDYTPLLQCHNLEFVATEFAKSSTENDEVFQQLEARGVELG